MTVLVPAALVLMLGASELMRDSSDRRVQQLNRVLTLAIAPLLVVFAYFVVDRMLEVL